MKKHAIRGNAEQFMAWFKRYGPRHATLRRLRGGCAAVVAVVLLLTFAPATAYGADTGSIAGRVTDQTGAPLVGIDVTAYGTFGSSGVYTGADGRYEITGLPAGDYVVRWWDSFFVYGGGIGYYDGALFQEDATPVHVAVDEVTQGIDGVLLNPPPGDGSIAGRVTDQQGRPLGGICVQAENRVNGGRGNAQTGADGTYLISALPTSDAYVVKFFDGCDGVIRYGAVAEYFDDAADRASADHVAVVDGQQTAGIDAALAVAGSISGQVTGEQGGALQSICVYVFTAGGDPTGQDPVFTDELGRYRLIRLASGSYKVGFVDCTQRYSARSELWDDASTLEEADAIQVVFGEDTGGIDATLDIPEFSGFVGPLRAPPTLVRARAGSVVPVRFSLGGDFGLDLLRFSTYSHLADCADPGGSTADYEPTVSVRNREFTYYAPTDRYRYRWQTDRAWRGTCRVFSLFLPDGERQVWLDFRRHGRPPPSQAQ